MTLKKVFILLMISFSLEASDNQLLANFDKYKNNIDNKNNLIQKGIKRNVYNILDDYSPNPTADLLKEWFKVASQVTYNDTLGFFIYNTDIKVKSLTTQLMFVENNAISPKDKAVLKEKFKFLYKFTKRQKPLNKTLFINVKNEHGKSGNLFLRTMPIVHELTIKRYTTGNFITLEDKSMVILLHEINFQKNNKNTRWGYIESPTDGRIGWISLKYTQEKK